MKKVFFILLTLAGNFAAQGQTLKDTLSFGKVDIVDYKKNKELFFSTSLDSASLSHFHSSSLASLLNENSGLFIKSFGAGSVASASAQGTSSYHTTIFWNGISISNPMLGQSDLALIPVSVADHIQLSNDPSVNGKVNIGTSVLLSNEPFFNRSFSSSLSTSIGSFGNYKCYLQTGVGNSRHSFTLKPFYEEGKNNFTYTNRARRGMPQMVQTNNALWQKGVTADYAFQATPHQLLTAHVWLQKNYRENPPSMTANASTAFQNDIINRYLVTYCLEKSTMNLLLKSAWLDEQVNYFDTIIDLTSPSRVQSLINSITLRRMILHRLQMESGINNAYYFAFTKDYQFKREANRSSLFTSLDWNTKRVPLFMRFMVQEELTGDQLNALSFSASGKFVINNYLNIHIQFAKTSRQPSLNDLFWVPGGNKNLLPENAYCYHAGFDFHTSEKWSEHTGQISFFNKSINNWIQWLPGSSGYWEPQNIYKVWTRGVELTAQSIYYAGKFNYQWNLQTSYTRATHNEKQLTYEQKQKQLIYVPELMITGGGGISYTSMLWSVNAHYCSKRFTTSDNQSYLDRMVVFSTSLEKKISMHKKERVLLRFSIFNLFDKNYETIQFRPMPGRNYLLTLQFNIDHNKK